MDNSEHITPELISPNRSHVHKGKALQSQTAVGELKKTKKSVLDAARKQSLEYRVSLIEPLFEVIGHLKAQNLELKKMMSADQYNIIQQSSKIERLELELAKLAKDHVTVCQEYAKIKGLGTIEEEYHPGGSKLPADS